MQKVEVTPTEYRVAHLMYEHGWSNTRIAEEMGCSPGSIKCHTRSLYAKTGTSSGRELIVWMRSNQLIPIHGYTSKKQDNTRRIERLLNQGVTNVSAIATQTGLAKATIRDRIKQLQK